MTSKPCFGQIHGVKIFPTDFILVLFTDYCKEIVTILTYLTKYGDDGTEPEVEEAPHLSDLRPTDFFFRDFKVNICWSNPHTIAALKEAITEKIQAMVEKNCARVTDNLTRCIQQCLQLNSRYLKHVPSSSYWYSLFHIWD